jgi:hypothetical protein
MEIPYKNRPEIRVEEENRGERKLRDIVGDAFSVYKGR